MERVAQMIPVLRDSVPSNLPPIPDDIIYQLIDCIGPVQVRFLMLFLYDRLLSFSILVGIEYHEVSLRLSIED